MITVLHVLTALAVIGLVLLQHGKGADMGAAFGSGASGSLFGATGSANFLSRSTAVLAAVFFVTSLGLTSLSASKSRDKGVMATHRTQPAAPAAVEKSESPPPLSVPEGSKAPEIPK